MVMFLMTMLLIYEFQDKYILLDMNCKLQICFESEVSRPRQSSNPARDDLQHGRWMIATFNMVGGRL